MFARGLLGWLLCAALAPTVWAKQPTDFALPSGELVAGAYLEDLTVLGPQVGRVRAATRTAFGVEIARVPVHVVTIADLRTLHAQIGGRLPPRWSLGGFELDGHVFVRRGLGGIPDEVLIHECLHALSRRFANEAHRRGVGKIVEGVTQYLTLKALDLRPSSGQLRRERNRTYVAPTGLADALATLVGEEVLVKAYFEEGFERLAERVDAVRHRRRVLLGAAEALEGGDEQAALAALTGSR